MKIKMFSVCALVFLCVSCSKSKITDEATVIEKCDFVAPRVQNSNLSLSDANRVSPIVIAEWDEWGRAKKDCRGWGLCNIVWFPESTPDDYTFGGFTAHVYGPFEALYYFDVLLTESPGNPVPAELATFGIDEEIRLNTYSELGYNLFVIKNDYPYDKYLGSAGGYRIYLHDDK